MKEVIKMNLYLVYKIYFLIAFLSNILLIYTVCEQSNKQKTENFCFTTTFLVNRVLD